MAKIERKNDVSLFGSTEEQAPDWSSMPPEPESTIARDYPYDGQSVLVVAPNGKGTAVVQWHVAREFMPRLCRWISTGRWARVNSGGRKLEFTPIGWKKFEEPPLIARRTGEAA